MFRKKDKAKIMIKFQVFPQSHSFYIIYSKAKEVSVDDTELIRKSKDFYEFTIRCGWNTIMPVKMSMQIDTLRIVVLLLMVLSYLLSEMSKISELDLMVIINYVELLGRK